MQAQFSGSIDVSSIKGHGEPGTFTIRASKLDYTDGLVYMRMSESEQDLNDVSQIINEAYPCLANGPFTPSVVFVASYICMELGDEVYKNLCFLLFPDELYILPIEC